MYQYLPEVERKLKRQVRKEFEKNVKNTFQQQLIKTSKEKRKKKKKADKLKFKLSQTSRKWSKTQKDNLLEDIDSCHQQLHNPETNLWNSEPKAVKNMNKRRYYKIVKKNRLCSRKVVGVESKSVQCC